MQHLFSTFPQFVDDELDRRRTDTRPGEPTALQKPKSPWMRMTSGFSSDAESGRERGRKILMGGDLDLEQRLQFGFEDLYEESVPTGEKYRPKPTITDISVDEQLESFECTVNWKAHSIDQIERLFPFFMNVGSSIFVDWGWSDVPPEGIVNVEDTNGLQRFYTALSDGAGQNQNDPRANEVAGNPGRFEDGPPQEQAVGSAGRIQRAQGAQSAGKASPRFTSVYDHPKYRALKEAQGRYSFVAGTISNFSFSPDGNNQYSCTTEVTSFSKAMAKLRNRNQENVRNASEGQTDDSEGGSSSGEEIKQDLFDFIKGSNFVEYLFARIEGSDASDVLDDVEQDQNDNVIRYEEGGKWNRREDTSENFTYFLTWEEIEKIVNEHAGYVKKNTAGTEDEIRLMKLDSAGSIIGNFQTGQIDEFHGDKLHLRSMDPFICVVDSVGLDEVPFRTFTDRNASPKIDRRLNDDASINKEREGFLYNLYFEYQFVIEAFNNNDTIHQALMYMLDKASAACFKIWDFRIIADSGRAKIFDRNAANTNASDLIGDGDEHVFRPNTADSILRDFSFDTNLSDAMKSRIVAQKSVDLEGKKSNAAINAREDGDAQFFQGFEGQDVITDNNMKKEVSERPETQDQLPGAMKLPTLSSVRAEGSWFFEEDKDWNELRKDAISALPGSPGGESFRRLLYKNRNEDSRARVFVRRMQADTEQNSPINGNNVLNINAQFTLDGIGGLCAYQAIRIENIPRVFRNNGVFMVDSITHSVSTDDWTTEVKTSYIVQNQLGDE